MARAEPDSLVAPEAKWRLGATSFVYPADWLGNVERLAGRVQDIELLFFEAENLPDDGELRALAQCKRAGHSYTVHTPLGASLASLDDGRRQRGIDEVCATIAQSKRLDPFAWIVHIYLGDHEGDRPPADLEAWRARAKSSLAQLCAQVDDPRRICVESIDYDFQLIEPVVTELDLSVAWDIGHFYRDARPWRAFWDRFGDRIRVVQWHGTDPQDRDHRSLRFVEPRDATELLRLLGDSGFDGVVTLEVFREHDFEESLALVDGWMQELTR